jgi:uncharacterized protein (DUF952 family)
MSTIFHITTKADWESAKINGFYVAPALKEEGFIHCCHENQVEDILSKYYTDRKDILCLKIETEKLTSQYIFEWSPSLEQTFPHVYGPINIDAVESVIEYSL